MRFRIPLAAAILLLAAPASSAGEDCEAPCIAYSISSSLQGDFVFSTNPSGLTGSDIGPSTDFTIDARPTDYLKFVGTVTNETVRDWIPGDHRAFEDIGAYVDSLYAEVTYEPALIRMGKFDPEFGVATNQLDGIYATDLVGDYDQSERWAVESVLNFEALGFNHAITASAFTTDRTALSDSIVTRRGRLNLSAGGPGNAEGLPSLALLLDGCKGAEASECYADGRFGYRLGMRFQKAGQATAEQIEDEIVPRDETGFLAAGTARFEIDEAVLRLLGEFAYFDRFDGEPDDAWFATASAAVEIEPWTVEATYTRQRNLVAGGPDTHADLVDVTASWDVGDKYSLAGGNWTIAAAYRYTRSDDALGAHTLGLKFTADLEGSISPGGKGKEE